MFLLDDFTAVDGIGVTNVARTICDIGGRFNKRYLGQIVDAALRKDQLTLEQLRRTAQRIGHAPSRKMESLHAVLKDRIPGFDPAASNLEADVLEVLTKAQLPMPRIGFEIKLGGILFHLDLAWPELKICVELDSWTYHQGRTAFDDDRKRTNLLMLEGWTALRFTDKTSHLEILEMLQTAIKGKRLAGLVL
jgi:very-short-patch-repair endonuclease